MVDDLALVHVAVLDFVGARANHGLAHVQRGRLGRRTGQRDQIIRDDHIVEGDISNVGGRQRVFDDVTGVAYGLAVLKLGFLDELYGRRLVNRRGHRIVLVGRLVAAGGGCIDNLACIHVVLGDRVIALQGALIARRHSCAGRGAAGRGNHGVADDDILQRDVAGVGGHDGVGQHAANLDGVGRAGQTLVQGQLGLDAHRRVFVILVVVGIQIRAVAAVIVDASGVEQLGDRVVNRIINGDGKRGLPAVASVQITNVERAHRTGAAVGCARPAGVAGRRVKRGVIGHGFGDFHTGGVLAARVLVVARVHHGVARRGRDAPVGLDDDQIRAGIHRRGLIVLVVVRGRVGAVVAVIFYGDHVVQLVHASRQRLVHHYGKVGAARLAAGQRADGQHAGRSGAVVGRTRPAGAAGTGVMGGVSRHVVGDFHPGGVLVAAVGVVKRVDERSTGRSGHAAVAFGNRQVNIGVHGNGVVVLVVVRGRIVAVAAVIGNDGGVVNALHARSQRVVNDHRKDNAAGISARKRAQVNNAGRARAVVGRAHPAAIAGCWIKRGVIGHGLGDFNAGGFLIADVFIIKRPRIGVTRGGTCASSGLGQHQVGGGVHRGGLIILVVVRGRVGAVAAVIVYGDFVEDVADARRQRRVNVHGKVDRAAVAGVQVANIENALAARHGVGAHPAAVAGGGVEGGVVRHCFSDFHPGGVLVAVVGVAQRVHQR